MISLVSQLFEISYQFYEFFETRQQELIVYQLKKTKTNNNENQFYYDNDKTYIN